MCQLDSIPTCVKCSSFFHGLISSVLCLTEVWPGKTQEENEDALLGWDMYGVCYFGFRPSKTTLIEDGASMNDIEDGL